MLIFAIIVVVIALFALLVGFTEVFPRERVVLRRRRRVIIEREVPVERHVVERHYIE